MKLNTVKKATKKQIETIVASELKKSQKIRQLFDSGVEVKEIQNLLGIRYQHVYNTVQNHIIKEGIEDSDITKAERGSGNKKEIEEALLSGLPLMKVATQFKKSYNYIWKINKELKQRQAN